MNIKSCMKLMAAAALIFSTNNGVATAQEVTGMRRVTFPNKTVALVGNLFLPKDFDEAKQYPAIICVHPAGSVKEQTSGLYAQKLSERGFIALAFDATYNGESGGEPRLLEDPFERCEDIRCAADFLTTLPYVNEHKIGALGLCAGGGYVMGVTPTERRISAVASINATDIGAANREGWTRTATIDDQIKRLESIAAQRTKEARGEEPLILPIAPEELTDNMDDAMREGYDYYRTPRAAHPRAVSRVRFSCTDKKMAFSSIAQAQLFTQPALLIVGSRAESSWNSRMIYDAIPGDNKELFVIEGASHIDLYDLPQYVNPAVDKLIDFYNQSFNQNK